MDAMLKAKTKYDNERLMDAFCKITVEEYKSLATASIYNPDDNNQDTSLEKYLKESQSQTDCIMLSETEDKAFLNNKLRGIIRALSNINKRILLLVPSGMRTIISKALEEETERQIALNNHIFDIYDDTNAVLTIFDQHAQHWSRINYLKVYTDGQVKIVIEDESDNDFKAYNMQLPEDLANRLKEFVKNLVHERAAANYRLQIDDRCFLSAFRVQYHYSFMGISDINNDIDMYEYFERSSNYEVIQELMDIPLVRDKFINRLIPSQKEFPG